MDTVANPAPERRALTTPELVAAALVAVAFGVAYAPNFAVLARTWAGNDTYTHGFLIIPIALFILWQRRDRLDRAALRPSIWGWAALLGILGLRAWLYERNEQWFENLTILPALAALALALGGWRLLRWTLPAIAFLVFMLPLPMSLNTILAYPLQRIATIGSTALLQGLGLPVLADGNIIVVGSRKLFVEKACSGLSMLQSFFALIAAVTILADRPRWEKGTLLASAVPIALISNILRITVTAWCYHHFGDAARLFGWTIDEVEHAVAGWAMMPIALALVWLELRLMAWLIVEEEVRAAPMVRPLGPLAFGGAAPPLKPAAKDKSRPAAPGIDPE